MAAPMTLDLCLLAQIREYCSICQLCNKDFTKPEVLPCFHVFCSDCLDSYVKRTVPENGKSLWLLCPACREIVSIPSSGLSTFPRNDFIQIVADNLNKSIDSNSNGRTATPVYSCCFCKLSATHLYCSDCKKNCCSTCTYQHLYHKVSSLPEQSEKIKCQLSCTQHDVQANLNMLNEVLKDARNYQTDLHLMRTELKKSVKKTAYDLKKVISEIEENLLSEIDTIVEKEDQNINEHVRRCEVGISSEKLVYSVIDFVNNNKDLNGIVSSVEFFQQAFEQLNQMHSNYPGMLPKRSMQLNKSTANMFDKISELFGTLQEQVVEEEEENCKWITKEYSLTSVVENTHFKESFCSDTTNVENETTDRLFTIPDICSVTNEIFVDSFDNCSLNFKETETLSTLTSSCVKICKISGMSCLPTGEIVVVDKNNKCVKFLKGNSVFRKIYGSESLCDVAVLDEDRVAISDKTVHIFSTKGKLIGVFRQKPRDSHGIACSKDNNLLVLDHKSSKLYNLMPKPDMQEVFNFTVSSLPESPSFIALDKNNGNVSMTSEIKNSVFTFTTSSNTYAAAKLTLSANVGGLNQPAGLCFDKNGRIFVCDKNNHRIIIIDVYNGYSVSCAHMPIQLCYPSAIDFDQNGNLVIAEECGRIRVLSVTLDC